jgi:CRP/FNR family transcriptional regulator, cyclic AMP receptor protein
MAEQLATIEKVFLLQSIDLFSNAPAEALLRMAHIASEEKYNSGDVIQREGSTPAAFYVVVQGRVMLTSKILDRSEEAIEHQTFGILPVLDGGPLLFTAVCAEDSLLLRIDSEDFFDHLTDDEEIVKSIVRYLARQAREKQQ